VIGPEYSTPAQLPLFEIIIKATTEMGYTATTQELALKQTNRRHNSGKTTRDPVKIVLKGEGKSLGAMPKIEFEFRKELIRKWISESSLLSEDSIKGLLTDPIFCDKLKIEPSPQAQKRAGETDTEARSKKKEIKQPEIKEEASEAPSGKKRAGEKLQGGPSKKLRIDPEKAPSKADDDSSDSEEIRKAQQRAVTAKKTIPDTQTILALGTTPAALRAAVKKLYGIESRCKKCKTIAADVVNQLKEANRPPK